MAPLTALVVGATGATGKHVVKMLLDQGHTVKAVARSKEKMIGLLQVKDSSNREKYDDRLIITEASILDLPVDDIRSLIDGCDAVISCLGHTMDFTGLFGSANRRLCTDTVKKLTDAIPSDSSGTKFILMSSEGVAHPDGTTDTPRPLLERSIIWLIRNLITPHADNEEAALYLYNHRNTIAWSVVRPTDLIDADEATGEYGIYDSPQGSLFGSGDVTRANVAHFMVQLVVNDETWSKYKHKMPVIKGEKEVAKETTE